MPQMGESVTEGTVLEWHKKVGEHVSADETLVEISTDKVDAEVPAPASGTIASIHVAEGDTVHVGALLAEIATNGGAPATGEAPAATNGHAGASRSDGNGGQSAAATAAPSPPAAASPSPATSDGARVSPVAARAATVEGVDLTNVAGSGPAGRIVKADVLAAAADGGAQGTLTPLRGGAAMLARYMDESRSIPTATSVRTFAVTTLDARRRELKAAGLRVSYTHLIAFAIARAAHEMPVMAQHFVAPPDGPARADDGQVNLGLAVDVEKKDGSRTLMVPVIRGAGGLPFAGFLNAYDALVDKARTNTLTADDLQGGNITLTNPGGLGTDASVPRLMVGQGTILATGAIGYPPGLEQIGEMIGADKVMTMTSTYDHRVIQGAQSGRFLALVESYLQGEDGFYEDVFESLGVALGQLPPPPAPAAAAAASRQHGRRSDDGSIEELLGAMQAATAPPRRSAPTAISARTSTRWGPSRRAIRRWTPSRTACHRR